ncbi:MAG: shikimate kinase [Terrimicrobiaceae bacterium]
MLPNIALIGFMGCGKSSVGRRLAVLTGHRFVDTDDLIVQAERRSIAEIFASEGEEHFRVIEKRVLSELVGVCGVVLSTGGGLVLDPENCASLRKVATVAWLDADPDVLFERATRTSRRPLLQTQNPRLRFDELLEKRIPIYTEFSDFRVDSTGIGHDEAAAQILDLTLRHRRRFDC